MSDTTVTHDARPDRNRAVQQASAVDYLSQIGDLSRIVEHDIRILRTLTKSHCDHERNHEWEPAWARLESAWKAVQSELADGATSTAPGEIASSASGAGAALPQVDEPPASSAIGRFVGRNLGIVKNFGSALAWPGATHARTVRSRLVEVAQALAAVWEAARSRLASAWRTTRSRLRDLMGAAETFAFVSATYVRRVRPRLVEVAQALAPVWEAARLRLAGAWRTTRSRLRDLMGAAERLAFVSATYVRRVRPRLIEVAQAPAPVWEAARLRLASAWRTTRSRLRDLMGAAERFAFVRAAHAHKGWPLLEAKGRIQMRIPVRSTSWSVVAERIRSVDRSSIAERESALERPAALGNTGSHPENARETVRRQPVRLRATVRVEAASPATPTSSATNQAEEPMRTSPVGPFVLEPLPWLVGSLAPVISSRTMQVHYGSHYAACIDSANRLSRNYEELAGKSALDIVRWAREHSRDRELLAAASEAWNHAFFWQSLTPWKKRPDGELCHAIDRAFGDFANFAREFALAGAAHVGNGWLWLVANRRKQVRILTTSGAESPEPCKYTCLLVLDLWEHAYYFDHQSRRGAYLDAVIDRRLDWEFAEARYRILLKRGPDVQHEPRRRPPRKRSKDVAESAWKLTKS
jgi:superoxide dismutase, Fe-Mn family